MNTRNSILAAFLVVLCVGTAFGAITKEEASKLGTTLTPIGAEKAGNKEGTIPEYTGGLTKFPAGYKKGSGRYVDPFADEKPLFTITKENMAKYAQNLTEGTKGLLLQKPGFRMDVYKTHRTVVFPDYVNEGTKKAALTARLKQDGNSFEGALSGYPFPIPKNGNEVMWNHLVHYTGEAQLPERTYGYLVDASGRAILVGKGAYITEKPYWYRTNPQAKNAIMYRGDTTGPPRKAGENYLAYHQIDHEKYPHQVWQYLVGQRRVKNAPDLTYDAPNPIIAGGSTCDDSYIFGGELDRLDFKLIGKKEMYVPYNSYKLGFYSTPETLLGPKFINPDYNRWELHRVWVVEATTKKGKRHLYGRRTFYVDEDSWAALTSDIYDQKGKLYRANYAYFIFAYDGQSAFNELYGTYDFIAGGYSLAQIFFNDGTLKVVPRLKKEHWNPDSLAGSSIN